MKKICLALPFILCFAACEEVIELDLQSGEQRTVAEANLDATNGNCTVSLSKSGDFYESNVFEKIEGASVILKKSGDEILLENKGNGRYFAENIALTAGDVYNLDIVFPDGSSAESDAAVVPIPTQLDTLILEKVENNGGFGGSSGSGDDPQFSLTAEWQDPAGTADFYRLKIFKNGSFESDLYLLADDRLGDGQKISRPVIRETFSEGDTLRVQLLSVSKGYYDYFTDLANAEGRGLSAPVPYNPKGNFSGDLLGYFGLWWVSEKVVVVR